MGNGKSWAWNQKKEELTATAYTECTKFGWMKSEAKETAAFLLVKGDESLYCRISSCLPIVKGAVQTNSRHSNFSDSLYITSRIKNNFISLKRDCIHGIPKFENLLYVITYCSYEESIAPILLQWWFHRIKVLLCSTSILYLFIAMGLPLVARSS